MATETQKKYIADLTVLKTKEFKEVKELLVSSGIVKDTSETVMQAQTINEITGALTDLQASQFIDLLIQTKEPNRGTTYSKKRINLLTGELDHIKAIINGWDFGTQNYAALVETILPQVQFAVAAINNPEIAPEVRQRNQEVLLREVGKAIYEKVYDMNAFDMEIEHTKGAGIDDRYFGLAKVLSDGVSNASREAVR